MGHPLHVAHAGVLIFLFSFLLFAAANSGATTQQTDKQPNGWKLTWSDEFNSATPAVDPSKWSFEIGGNGWGNNELEYYTDRPQNAHLQDGNLVISAVAGNFTGSDGVSRPYTSARLRTHGKFTQKYGRFEARIKLPSGKGMWPAFWLLGDDIDSARWPGCGEIDIMENVGSNPSVVLGTIHGPGYSGDAGPSAKYVLSADKRFSDDFHVMAVEWEPSVIRFYVDGNLYKTRTPADLPAGKKWVFDHPFFIILNLAVGGNLPGSPDAATRFPQSMHVDYVRVYERK